MVSFLVWLGPRGPCGPMGGGALPAHGLAGRVEVSGLDAGAAGGGPDSMACGRAGAGRFWPGLAGVAGIFFQGAALVLAVVWTLLVGLSVLCRDEAYSVVRKVILGVSICVVIGSAVTEGLFSGLFRGGRAGGHLSGPDAGGGGQRISGPPLCVL